MIKTRYTRSRYYPSVFIARYVLRSISFQVNLIAGAVDNTAGLKLHSFSVVLSSIRSPEWRDWGLPDSRNLRILFVRIISAFIEQNKRLGSWAALGIQTFTLSCDFLNSVWSQSYSIMSMSKIAPSIRTLCNFCICLFFLFWVEGLSLNHCFYEWVWSSSCEFSCSLLMMFLWCYLESNWRHLIVTLKGTPNVVRVTAQRDETKVNELSSW